VTLTAAPGPGQVFTGWGGACTGTGPTCTLQVSGATQVSAGFEPAPTFPVTVTVTGSGRVTSAPAGIDCPGACTADLRDTVTLTAAPGPGQVFTSWGGACTGSGTGPTCTLQVSGATQVSAGFRAPAAPTADPGPDRTVNEGVAATLTGTGTSPDGLALTFRWSVDGGPPKPGRTRTVTFGDQGSHTATLTVCDTTGTCATDTMTLTVRNVAPGITGRSPTPVVVRADTTATPLPVPGVTRSVTASDVPADPLVYRWTFGDGAAATTTTGTVGHTYRRLGGFTATVTVDDGDGGAASAQWVVYVMATGACDPNAKENNRRYDRITNAWGGVGGQVTVLQSAPAFTFEDHDGRKKTDPVPVAADVSAAPGDVMTLQRSGPHGRDARQLQIGCGPDGARYLQVFIPRLNRTVYVREAALVRL
jgi:hypothetical protein